MEKKTEIEDRGNTLCESRVDGCVDGNNSLLTSNVKRIWQERYIQQENAIPRTGYFSNSTVEPPSKGHRNEETAIGVTTASVAWSESIYLRPGERRCLFSGIKNLQRGPLKKRSPKLSPSVSSKYSLSAPVSTPVGATFPPDLSRSQTSSSGFSSLDSISSASSLLASSIVKMERENPYHLPVKRNLSKQLMGEPILTTPKMISSTGRRLTLSNKTMQPFNPNHVSSLTPIPFSFSKKRKLCNPVVTNMSKFNSASDLFSKPPDTDETRGQETHHLSDGPIEDLTCDRTKTISRPSSAINILRITHPFGNYPLVTKRSLHKPISSPLAEVPKTPSKNSAHSNSHLHRDTKVRKNMLFSPLLRRGNASFDINIPARPSHVKSIITKTIVRGAKNSKSKKGTIGNQTSKNLSNHRPELFLDVPITNRPCKCKKSKCLKLYCECFHSASFCDPDLCHCIDCMNSEAHNSTGLPRGRRVLAMLDLLAKRPNAFDGGGRKSNTKGCRCKKSRCANKFCECVASGKLCTEACSCCSCQNPFNKRCLASRDEYEHHLADRHITI